MKTWVATAAMVALTGAACASPAFQGRLADKAASATCTSNGAGGTTNCSSFYLSDSSDSGFQGFTILNNWNIGSGPWDDGAATGSAQDIAADAGLAATGLDGWLLPTGDDGQPAGALNQYPSIRDSVGNSLAGLQAHEAVAAPAKTSGHFWGGKHGEA